MPSGSGVGEWGHTFTITQVDVGTVLDQEGDDLLVWPPAIGQQDRLEQGGPAEPVDVVDVDVRFVQEIPHDLDMPSL